MCPSPADLDELAVYRLQCRLILHSGAVLQLLLSHLLLPLKPLLDHAEAAAGPPLLPALCHHTCSSAAAQVRRVFDLCLTEYTSPSLQIFMTRAVTYICTRCLSCLSEEPGIHLRNSAVLMSGSVLLSRYFYRACQGTLFPSPVQVGRQLDKLPSETRRNILSLSRVKVGSPLSPKPPFLSLTKPSPKGCNKKDQRSFPSSKTQQGPFLQTDEQGQRSPLGPTNSERGLSDLYTSVPTEKDTLPYTKDAPKLSREPQPPPTKDSECLDKTLEASDLSLSSWITSTPLLSPSDSVQLNLPPDGDSQCVKYTRNSEERLQSDHSVHPAQRTEQVAEQSLHTIL